MPIEIIHLAYTWFDTDPRVQREARAAVLAGRRVAVVTLRGPHQAAVERTQGLLVLRLPGGKSRGSFVSYLLEYASFVVRCRSLLRHRRFGAVRLVHVATLPDFLVWAALGSQRRGAKIVLDLHEIFPEFVTTKWPGFLGHLVARIARRIERWARRRADLTITVNRPIEALLASRPAKPDEIRLVIHNSPDPAHFGAAAQDSAPDPLSRAMSLVYHGTVTQMYGLDVAIQGTSLAQQHGTPCHLTIIGSGPDLPRLRGMADCLADPAVVTFESPIPLSRLAPRLRTFDAGVVPTRLDGMTRFSLSAKLLEYVWLGIPVLAAQLPSYQEYFAPDALWYWTPSSAEDLARAVTQLARTSPAERARRAATAREAALRIAWEAESRKLLDAYTRLLLPGDSRAITSAIRDAVSPSP